MTLFVGLDDTDSCRAMCTTFLATEIVTRLRPLGWDLIGYPRLVRLNPSVPWKTRGNGALCLRFGHGEGAPFAVGAFPGEEAEAYASSGRARPDENLLMTCRDAVLQLADLEAPGTRPGLVVTRRPPDVSLYWRAVREVVPLSEVSPWLDEADFWFAPKGHRGLIGALAATAWRPEDRTFEVLAYRERHRWGTRRNLVEADVAALEDRFPRTFNNYDAEAHHPTIAPRSPCPVLFGIRGEGPEELPAALATVRGEPLERWLVFETNQGTDDHLQFRAAEDLRPHTAATLEGRVQEPPRSLRGGHVVLSLRERISVACVAYEPSKSFREVVRALRPGDRVRVSGSVRRVPRSLNLEKLEVLELAEEIFKVANPRCVSCGKSMKSVGRGGGYRCRRCGTRKEAGAALFTRAKRNLIRGFYEPPVSARRHLSKPLKRMTTAALPDDSAPHEAFATASMDTARMSNPASSSSSSMFRAGM